MKDLVDKFCPKQPAVNKQKPDDETVKTVKEKIKSRIVGPLFAENGCVGIVPLNVHENSIKDKIGKLRKTASPHTKTLKQKHSPSKISMQKQDKIPKTISKTSRHGPIRRHTLQHKPTHIHTSQLEPIKGHTSQLATQHGPIQRHTSQPVPIQRHTSQPVPKQRNTSQPVPTKRHTSQLGPKHRNKSQPVPIQRHMSQPVLIHIHTSQPGPMQKYISQLGPIQLQPFQLGKTLRQQPTKKITPQKLNNTPWEGAPLESLMTGKTAQDTITTQTSPRNTTADFFQEPGTTSSTSMKNPPKLPQRKRKHDSLQEQSPEPKRLRHTAPETIEHDTAQTHTLQKGPLKELGPKTRSQIPPKLPQRKRKTSFSKPEPKRQRTIAPETTLKLAQGSKSTRKSKSKCALLNIIIFFFSFNIWSK